ncbi:enoyl-ACP reductase [Fimbriimonadia bacterium ATM]|nr:MAG: enoyl-ACP reductase [Armatimonadota bacterium]MBC6969402.1 SDR family NAD(P)-dependent oxidoreductase [Armatimonadota bacterium]MCE7899260.1 enoyl-ACP reductase [Armatimonadetes bacterium ATM1]MDL1927833.1 enoyl-ACP reductase [Fimbriimonadia bacterium ATM]RIJ97320.1 MAG: NADH-specific enoyl-ACP reductase [Armatimonadota bacterium]
MGLLEGKRGVVFGVANQRSIAWAVADLAAQHGATIAIGVQNERMAETAAKLIEGRSGFQLVQVDLNDDEQLTACAETLKRQFGALDFAVHSVAYALREDLAGRFIETSREGFKVALETSAYTFVAMAKALEEIFAEDASVITMTYLGSQRVLPGYNVMGVAKAALEAATRYLAHDLGDRGIRVNAVSPGPINTVAARGIRGFTQILDVVSQRTPLKRPAEQAEVANTSLYLLSDLSRGVTGQTIYVDSGYSVMGL